MKIACGLCEIAHKCRNKPQKECIDYMMFRPIQPKKKLIGHTEDKLSTVVDEHPLTPNKMSMGECQFCGRLDHDLVYIQIYPNVYACEECAENLKDNDEETNELIDKLFEAEAFAREKKVNKELAGILFTAVQSIKDAINGKTKAIEDLSKGCGLIAHREAIRMLKDKGILNDGDEKYQ